MRDRVYGKPITDNEWRIAGPHWMTADGIRFLKAHDFPLSESSRRSTAAKPC
jgi:hypothetical protein